MFAILWESKNCDETEWEQNKVVCQTREEMLLRQQQIWNFNPMKVDIQNFEVVEIND